MLKLEQIKLKDGMVIVDMEIPQVSDTTKGGVHKTESQKELELRQTEHRVGVILNSGIISEELLVSILGGKDQNPVGKVVLFSAMSIDPFRIPIEGHENSALVLVNFGYLLGTITEE